ncbi:MAG: response regulator [Deltaproteobacteria bacterium]|nr:response regulator [Deltaproteobacteria bacterium]
MAKILIIDDDQDIIDSLTMILEGNGHQVQVKTDTDNLVASVSEVGPDLIILDIMFPEDPQAGFVAARELNKNAKLKNIPVLLLSAVNQRSNMAFGFSDADISPDFMPVEAFIEKPVEPDVLIRKIAEMLEPTRSVN